MVVFVVAAAIGVLVVLVLLFRLLLLLLVRSRCLSVLVTADVPAVAQLPEPALYYRLHAIKRLHPARTPAPATRLCKT